MGLELKYDEFDVCHWQLGVSISQIGIVRAHFTNRHYANAQIVYIKLVTSGASFNCSTSRKIYLYHNSNKNWDGIYVSRVKNIFFINQFSGTSSFLPPSTVPLPAKLTYPNCKFSQLTHSSYYRILPLS